MLQRKKAFYPVTDISLCKEKMLCWLTRYSIFSFLDNHQYTDGHHNIECLAGAGAFSQISPKQNCLSALDAYIQSTPDWLFGHLGYGLKDEIFGSGSAAEDPIGFPDLFFFQPETVLRLHDSGLEIASLTEEPDLIFQAIMETETALHMQQQGIRLTPVISRTEYIRLVERLRQHIHRGDCYEINFCQPFEATNATIDPLTVYRELTQLSPNPFSCFYRLNERYLLCASPERYLQKKGNRLISQPIKGTYPRDFTDPAKDAALKKALLQSPKERSENVMVVDLVRNDMSRICTEGTVTVSELFGIYSFPQVHQMISTIEGEIKPGITTGDMLRASFPMGSMTGAPKKKVLELIEQYEPSHRGLFSGAVGYITPEADFDFNVVIRSIFYQEHEKLLRYWAGSGITFYSDPEKEYEECLVKAAAIRKVLGDEIL
jgi:para-aminobenzoate synthetase component 1